MAMTVDEMMVFLGEQSEESSIAMRLAMSSSNYYLATFNCGDAVECRLMQGLLTWRQGKDPSGFFRDAVSCCDEGWSVMSSIGGDQAKRADAPFERVAMFQFLIEGRCPTLCTDGLEANRLLDAVLCEGLAGEWDAAGWDRGMGQLQRHGDQLVLDTYTLYARIITSVPDELPGLIQEGEAVFVRRKKDEYFSGGDQTEGGGPDNDYTVDFRLGVLMKLKGIANADCVHAWRW